MSREQRRRRLLRAHSAAARFAKRQEAEPYFSPATDAFVAGWLLGYRAAMLDERKVRQQLSEINLARALEGAPAVKL